MKTLNGWLYRIVRELQRCIDERLPIRQQCRLFGIGCVCAAVATLELSLVQCIFVCVCFFCCCSRCRVFLVKLILMSVDGIFVQYCFGYALTNSSFVDITL